MVNKRVWNAVLGCNLKNDRIISVCFQGKPFNITVIQPYVPTSNAEEGEVEWFYEDLQDLLELTPKKDVLLIIGDWNAKGRSQETPGVTSKFGLGVQNEAGQRLIEFCQENILVITNTLFQQHKRRLYTWTSPDGRHRNQIGYILCSQRWRSSISSGRTRPGADCCSDHELLIAKFRLKLNKVGKTLDHSHSYDLSIPYFNILSTFHQTVIKLPRNHISDIYFSEKIFLWSTIVFSATHFRQFLVCILMWNLPALLAFAEFFMYSFMSSSEDTCYDLKEE